MTRGVVLGGALLLGLFLPLQELRAQQAGPQPVSATATLSILAGTVQRVPAGSSQPHTAADGMDLSVGDRIMTGPKATALVTFLDGSTLTVQPDSDVTVRRADIGGKKSSIGVRVNLGTVWARVVRLADPQSSFSLESNTATATVHDGLIGGRQNPDGSFVCWSMAGALMTVKGSPEDQSVLTLQPGQEAVVKPGMKPVPQSHPVSVSWVKITASAEVHPLVLMPDKVRVAGYVAPGIEVNQVLGSVTGAAMDRTHVVEVPAGVQGPFTLVLEGRQDGPFKVKLVGLVREGQFKEKPAYHLELAGTIKKGERVSTEITQQMDPATVADPKTAKVRGGSVTPLKPLQGPLPGKVLLATAELTTTGGN
jgi:hypothetical protein